MANRKRKDPLVWGIVLIAIGVLFFFQRADFDIWGNLARLWPVILIAWGAVKLLNGLSQGRGKPKA